MGMRERANLHWELCHEQASNTEKERQETGLNPEKGKGGEWEKWHLLKWYVARERLLESVHQIW